MKIVVCVKQVPGTNAVHLDPDTGTLIREARHAIINPFDAFAVEQAVRLQEKYGGETIVLSMGIPATEKILRDVLSRGIDQAVLLTDSAFAGADTWATAYTLSAAIHKIGSVDLVLCGKMAIDGDTAQTGPELAECLGFVPLTDVSEVRERSAGKLTVRQNIEGGYRDLAVSLPALLTIAKDACKPRLPSIHSIMQSRGKPLLFWTADDLALDKQLIGRPGSPTRVVETTTPVLKKETITLSDDVKELACLLRKELMDGPGHAFPMHHAEHTEKEHQPAGAKKIGTGKFAPVMMATADALQPGGIWVFAETVNQQIHPVVFELLSCARHLADQPAGKQVTVVLCGSSAGLLAGSLVANGADNILLCDDAAVNGQPQDICTELITRLVRQYKPDIFLFGATAYGRAVAPRLAARLQTGLTADCTQLRLQEETGLLLQTRPAFGGNMLATIVTDRHRPQMATVRPGVMKPESEQPARHGCLIMVEAPQTVQRVHVLKQFFLPARPGIADAPVIVSAGRGIASQKNLQLVVELAGLLGGQCGVTRPLVDLGWAESSWQIGQTGQAVAPQLLIACGISGAIQHLAGISGARKIIAINTDPDAPVFSMADYRLVGDCIPILRQLIRFLRQ